MRRGEAVEEVVSAREEVPYTHIETENQLPQRTLTLIALITLTLADLFFSAQSPPPFPSPRASPHRICTCLCREKEKEKEKEGGRSSLEREHTHVHTYIHTVHTYSKYSTVQVVFTCRCLLVVVCIAALPVKEFILLRGLKFSVRGQEQEKCRDPSS